jgi:hypothetical protein
MPTTYERLDYGSSDGSQIGGASTDLIAFHGATPCDQAAAITSVSTSAAVSVCGAFAFTSAQANGLITAVNSILAALNEKGLTA